MPCLPDFSRSIGSRRILVVGDVMLDVIAKPDGPLNLGTDRRARIECHAGGSAANQAAWIAERGGPVTLAARVGAADAGFHAAALARLGVEPRLAIDERLQTGILVCLVGPDGERSFLTDRGANDNLCADDLPDDLLDGIALLHVSGYALFSPVTRAAVGALMERARRRAIPVTLDPASTGFIAEIGVAAFLAASAGAAVCFPNRDEAALLTGTEDPAEQRRRLARHYPLTVIKRGASGADLSDATGALLHTAVPPPVTAVDTTGAGDAFLAGFLVTLVAGEPLDRCLAAAVAAGAEAVGAIGGRPAGSGALIPRR